MKKLFGVFFVAALILPTIGVFATPTHPSPAPTVSISSVRPVDSHPNYLQWYVNNTGDTDVWVAAYAVFYQRTETSSGYIKSGEAVGYSETIQVGI